MKALNDPTAHAEMLAIRSALAKRGTGRLDGCDLYVTLEPCAMCAGAIAHVRLRRVYFAAEDVKAGAVENGVRLFSQPTCHHAPEVIGGIGAISVFKAVYIDRRELKCACVGGSSKVPLGFVSLTENVMMVAMAVWMAAM